MRCDVCKKDGKILVNGQYVKMGKPEWMYCHDCKYKQEKEV